MSTYDPAALECLAAIVEEGGFERAAQRLNITQSAVSQRLRSLEAQVGTVLVVRSRPVRPTSAGHLLLKHTRQLRLLRADLDRDLRELAPGRGGAREEERVSIAVNADSIATWALPALDGAVRQGVPLEIITDDQDFTHEWLREGRVLGCVTTVKQALRGCKVLPLGVVAQAVLGGYTVRHELEPGYVMGHFGLSMLVLIPAVALAWRARYEPGTRPLADDAATVWLVRAAAALGVVVLFAGTVATAAGPHAGGTAHQLIHRLHFKGASTLTWVIHRHATIAVLLGLCVIGAWLLARRRGNQMLVDTLTVAGVLMAAQGLVGSVQYELRLPADIVWVHVTLATITWIVLLWAVGAAGRLAPSRLAVPRREGAGERPATTPT